MNVYTYNLDCRRPLCAWQHRKSISYTQLWWKPSSSPCLTSFFIYIFVVFKLSSVCLLPACKRLDPSTNYYICIILSHFTHVLILSVSPSNTNMLLLLRLFHLFNFLSGICSLKLNYMHFDFHLTNNHVKFLFNARTFVILTSS